MQPAPRLVVVAPPTVGIYRLARGSAEPFVPPSWEFADPEDGTFGNRFDDPGAKDGLTSSQRFRTIYCSTQRSAAFAETLAQFRPALSLLVLLEKVVDDESTEEALLGATHGRPHFKGLSQPIGDTVAASDTRIWIRAFVSSMWLRLKVFNTYGLLWRRSLPTWISQISTLVL